MLNFEFQGKKGIIWKLLVGNFLHEVSQYQHKITSIFLKNEYCIEKFTTKAQRKAIKY